MLSVKTVLDAKATADVLAVVADIDNRLGRRAGMNIFTCDVSVNVMSIGGLM